MSEVQEMLEEIQAYEDILDKVSKLGFYSHLTQEEIDEQYLKMFGIDCAILRNRIHYLKRELEKRQ